MTVHVYIDSCAWNFLFHACINLKKELPPDLYQLHITKEIEIELAAIPKIGKDGEDKRDLKHYIAVSIAQGDVTTTGTFGFQTLEPDGTQTKAQTYCGFGQGTFQSDQERNYYASQEVQAQIIGKPTKKSGLSAEQGDASLAVHAISAVILTDEKSEKAGPLKLAASKGGKIVYLSTEFQPSGLSLGAYLASIS